MLVEVSRPGTALSERTATHPEESSHSTRQRVVSLGNEDRTFLAAAIERRGLSVRVYHGVLRVARSIADVDDCADIDAARVAEALVYRIGDARRL